jgi:hypothetical protein
MYILQIHYKKERRPTALRRGERKRASGTEARLRERQQEMKRKQTGRKQGRREEMRMQRGFLLFFFRKSQIERPLRGNR